MHGAFPPDNIFLLALLLCSLTPCHGKKSHGESLIRQFFTDVHHSIKSVLASKIALTIRLLQQDFTKYFRAVMARWTQDLAVRTGGEPFDNLDNFSDDEILAHAYQIANIQPKKKGPNPLKKIVQNSKTITDIMLGRGAAYKELPLSNASNEISLENTPYNASDAHALKSNAEEITVPPLDSETSDEILSPDDNGLINEQLTDDEESGNILDIDAISNGLQNSVEADLDSGEPNTEEPEDEELESEFPSNEVENDLLSAVVEEISSAAEDTEGEPLTEQDDAVDAERSSKAEDTGGEPSADPDKSDNYDDDDSKKENLTLDDEIDSEIFMNLTSQLGLSATNAVSRDNLLTKSHNLRNQVESAITNLTSQLIGLNDTVLPSDHLITRTLDIKAQVDSGIMNLTRLIGLNSTEEISREDLIAKSFHLRDQVNSGITNLTLLLVRQNMSSEVPREVLVTKFLELRDEVDLGITNLTRQIVGVLEPEVVPPNSHTDTSDHSELNSTSANVGMEVNDTSSDNHFENGTTSRSFVFSEANATTGINIDKPYAVSPENLTVIQEQSELNYSVTDVISEVNGISSEGHFETGFTLTNLNATAGLNLDVSYTANPESVSDTLNQSVLNNTVFNIGTELTDASIERHSETGTTLASFTSMNINESGGFNFDEPYTVYPEILTDTPGSVTDSNQSEMVDNATYGGMDGNDTSSDRPFLGDFTLTDMKATTGINMDEPNVVYTENLTDTLNQLELNDTVSGKGIEANNTSSVRNFAMGTTAGPFNLSNISATTGINIDEQYVVDPESLTDTPNESELNDTVTEIGMEVYDTSSERHFETGATLSLFTLMSINATTGWNINEPYVVNPENFTDTLNQSELSVTVTDAGMQVNDTSSERHVVTGTTLGSFTSTNMNTKTEMDIQERVGIDSTSSAADLRISTTLNSNVPLTTASILKFPGSAGSSVSGHDVAVRSSSTPAMSLRHSITAIEATSSANSGNLFSGINFNTKSMQMPRLDNAFSKSGSKVNGSQRKGFSHLMIFDAADPALDEEVPPPSPFMKKDIIIQHTANLDSRQPSPIRLTEEEKERFRVKTPSQPEIFKSGGLDKIYVPSDVSSRVDQRPSFRNNPARKKRDIPDLVGTMVKSEDRDAYIRGKRRKFVSLKTTKYFDSVPGSRKPNVPSCFRQYLKRRLTHFPHNAEPILFEEAEPSEPRSVPSERREVDGQSAKSEDLSPLNTEPVFSEEAGAAHSRSVPNERQKVDWKQVPAESFEGIAKSVGITTQIVEDSVPAEIIKDFKTSNTKTVILKKDVLEKPLRMDSEAHSHPARKKLYYAKSKAYPNLVQSFYDDSSYHLILPLRNSKNTKTSEPHLPLDENTSVSVANLYTLLKAMFKPIRMKTDISGTGTDSKEILCRTTAKLKQVSTLCDDESKLSHGKDLLKTSRATPKRLLFNGLNGLVLSAGEVSGKKLPANKERTERNNDSTIAVSIEFSVNPLFNSSDSSLGRDILTTSSSSVPKPSQFLYQRVTKSDPHSHLDHQVGDISDAPGASYSGISMTIEFPKTSNLPSKISSTIAPPILFNDICESMVATTIDTSTNEDPLVKNFEGSVIHPNITANVPHSVPPTSSQQYRPPTTRFPIYAKSFFHYKMKLNATQLPIVSSRSDEEMSLNHKTAESLKVAPKEKFDKPMSTRHHRTVEERRRDKRAAFDALMSMIATGWAKVNNDEANNDETEEPLHTDHVDLKRDMEEALTSAEQFTKVRSHDVERPFLDLLKPQSHYTDPEPKLRMKDSLPNVKQFSNVRLYEGEHSLLHLLKQQSQDAPRSNHFNLIAHELHNKVSELCASFHAAWLHTLTATTASKGSTPTPSEEMKSVLMVTDNGRPTELVDQRNQRNFLDAGYVSKSFNRVLNGLKGQFQRSPVPTDSSFQGSEKAKYLPLRAVQYEKRDESPVPKLSRVEGNNDDSSLISVVKGNSIVPFNFVSTIPQSNISPHFDSKTGMLLDLLKQQPQDSLRSNHFDSFAHELHGKISELCASFHAVWLHTLTATTDRESITPAPIGKGSLMLTNIEKGKPSEIRKSEKPILGASRGSGRTVENVRIVRAYPDYPPPSVHDSTNSSIPVRMAKRESSTSKFIFPIPPTRKHIMRLHRKPGPIFSGPLERSSTTKPKSLLKSIENFKKLAKLDLEQLENIDLEDGFAIDEIDPDTLVSPSPAETADDIVEILALPSTTKGTTVTRSWEKSTQRTAAMDKIHSAPSPASVLSLDKLLSWQNVFHRGVDSSSASSAEKYEEILTKPNYRTSNVFKHVFSRQYDVTPLDSSNVRLQTGLGKFHFVVPRPPYDAPSPSRPTPPHSAYGGIVAIENRTSETQRPQKTAQMSLGGSETSFSQANPMNQGSNETNEGKTTPRINIYPILNFLITRLNETTETEQKTPVIRNSYSIPAEGDSPADVRLACGQPSNLNQNIESVATIEASVSDPIDGRTYDLKADTPEEVSPPPLCNEEMPRFPLPTKYNQGIPPSEQEFITILDDDIINQGPQEAPVSERQFSLRPIDNPGEAQIPLPPLYNQEGLPSAEEAVTAAIIDKSNHGTETPISLRQFSLPPVDNQVDPQFPLPPKYNPELLSPKEESAITADTDSYHQGSQEAAVREQQFSLPPKDNQGEAQIPLPPKYNQEGPTSEEEAVPTADIEKNNLGSSETLVKLPQFSLPLLDNQGEPQFPLPPKYNQESKLPEQESLRTADTDKNDQVSPDAAVNEQQFSAAPNENQREAQFVLPPKYNQEPPPAEQEFTTTAEIFKHNQGSSEAPFNEQQFSVASKDNQVEPQFLLPPKFNPEPPPSGQIFASIEDVDDNNEGSLEATVNSPQFSLPPTDNQENARFPMPPFYEQEPPSVQESTSTADEDETIQGFPEALINERQFSLPPKDELEKPQPPPLPNYKPKSPKSHDSETPPPLLVKLINYLGSASPIGSHSPKPSKKRKEMSASRLSSSDVPSKPASTNSTPELFKGSNNVTTQSFTPKFNLTTFGSSKPLEQNVARKPVKPKQFSRPEFPDFVAGALPTTPASQDNLPVKSTVESKTVPNVKTTNKTYTRAPSSMRDSSSISTSSMSPSTPGNKVTQGIKLNLKKYYQRHPADKIKFAVVTRRMFYTRNPPSWTGTDRAIIYPPAVGTVQSVPPRRTTQTARTSKTTENPKIEALVIDRKYYWQPFLVKDIVSDALRLPHRTRFYNRSNRPQSRLYVKESTLLRKVHTHPPPASSPPEAVRVAD